MKIQFYGTACGLFSNIVLAIKAPGMTKLSEDDHGNVVLRSKSNKTYVRTADGMFWEVKGNIGGVRRC